MPHSHSPDSPQWSNSFAVCAIMRDENITDVREWIHYYKCAHAANVITHPYPQPALCDPLGRPPNTSPRRVRVLAGG